MSEDFKTNWIEKVKGLFTSSKELFTNFSIRFEEVCVKLDEMLPRKSYIFFAMSCAVLLSLLLILF
jgi:hypothetical protein